MQYKPLTVRCLEELEAAAGETQEIAARLGEHWKIVAATLSNLHAARRVERRKVCMKGRGRGLRYFYFLPGTTPKATSSAARSFYVGAAAGSIYMRQFKW